MQPNLFDHLIEAMEYLNVACILQYEFHNAGEFLFSSKIYGEKSTFTITFLFLTQGLLSTILTTLSLTIVSSRHDMMFHNFYLIARTKTITLQDEIEVIYK